MSLATFDILKSAEGFDFETPKLLATSPMPDCLQSGGDLRPLPNLSFSKAMYATRRRKENNGLRTTASACQHVRMQLTAHSSSTQAGYDTILHGAAAALAARAENKFEPLPSCLASCKAARSYYLSVLATKPLPNGTQQNAVLVGDA